MGGHKAGSHDALTLNVTGYIWVNFPEICKLYGWDQASVCGPVALGANEDHSKNEKNCCNNHPSGCAKHKQQLVRGVPFKLSKHKDELVKKGLTVFRQELKDEVQGGRTPPGQPKKVNGALVYPARHFGQPE